MVGDLTTSSFLNALKRFISRRGICTQIHSDNATNFVGADSKLKRLYKKLNSIVHERELREYLLNNKITWKFIPPRSPHFAGIWERAIRSAKHHLKRIFNIYNMDFEQFYTILTQIESILNSRPICPLTNDPNDLEPLTPGHFLIGASLTSLPQEDVTTIPTNRLSQYQRLQQLLQHFWRRWSNEYINGLQQRSKWRFLNAENLKIGQMVLIKEEKLPVQDWRLGRITSIYPGKDGVVRVVDVLTCAGVVKRAFSKICILPIETVVES